MCYLLGFLLFHFLLQTLQAAVSHLIRNVPSYFKAKNIQSQEVEKWISVEALKKCTTSCGWFLFFSLYRLCFVALSVARANRAEALLVNLEWVRPFHCMGLRKAGGIYFSSRKKIAESLESWTWALETFGCEQHFDRLGYLEQVYPSVVYRYLRLCGGWLLCVLRTAVRIEVMLGWILSKCWS